MWNRRKMNSRRKRDRRKINSGRKRDRRRNQRNCARREKGLEDEEYGG